MASSSAPMQEVMLEFCAGRMFMEGSRVIPDKRKGLVRLAKGEEGLVHFQWLDRTLNKVEEDQIVFPDEAAFEKVHQSSERVYILKFTSDDRKLFFWMQEAAPDGDAQLCSSFNYYINRPLELVEDEPEASVPLPTSDMSEDMANEVSSRAGNMDTTSLLRGLGSEVSSFGPVQLADLQRILSNIEPEGAEDAGLGLGDILKPDLVVPLMETMPLDQQLRTYLPEGEWTADDVADLLQSPPFRQQVESFTYVLRTGQIDLSQFGIDPSKYKFTVVSFLEALEDSVGKTNNSMLEPSAAASGFSNQDENKDGGHDSPTCADGDKMDES